METLAPVLETPYERRGIVTPGMPILPHGVERHPIPGGGSRSVAINTGDEVSLLNVDGQQVAEWVFFTPDGHSDTAKLSHSAQTQSVAQSVAKAALSR